MFPVSLEYLQKSKEMIVDYKINIKIYHSTGVLDLYDEDLGESSLIFNEASQAGEEFTIGGTVASDISFEIIKKPEYDTINFIGARVHVITSLKTREGADAHFLQPSQPSKMLGFDERWEDVPLGLFNIDIADRKRNTILIKAIDNMIYLDKSYSLSNLSYPATLFQIYTNICSVADITIGTTDFPNKNYVVKTRPTNSYNLRDILGYVAELSGTFARCNRYGALELTWHSNANFELRSMNRSDFRVSDDIISITGIMFSPDDENVYLAGTNDYAIDLSDNPLLQDSYNTVLPNILDAVKDVAFIPYTSEWQGNPAIQAGDIITQIDVDGKSYNSVITNSMYKYRGRCIIQGRGIPDITRGFNGSTDKRIAQIVRKIDVEIGDKLTNLEQAQLNATELMANMLGGYVIEDKENGILYIADNPDISQATKMWKWGIGGFGYSSDGGQTWTTAVTADGSIVADLITAGIISADFIIGGILQSQDGSTWINMNDGSFNFKNALKWENNQLVITGIESGSKVFNTTPTPPYKVNDLWKVSGIAGVEFKICTTARASGSYVASDWTNVQDSKQYTDLIKNLTSGTAISGGIITIDRDKIRVAHTGSNQYSEMRYNGFYRQWDNGEGAYLNDIFIHYEVSSNQGSTSPRSTRVYLPERFRGRRVAIAVGGGNTYFNVGRLYSDGTVGRLTNWVDTVYRVYSSNLDATTPYVDIDAYALLQEYDDRGNRNNVYIGAGFVLIIIGE